MILTGLAASMVVNALVTGLIVFKILKVMWLKPEPTSFERTLGTLGSNGGSKLRHIIFIIIESGMALFVIQLVRVAITSVMELEGAQTPPDLLFDSDFVISTHQMLNVINMLFIFYFICFTDDIYLASRASHQQ